MNIQRLDAHDPAYAAMVAGLNAAELPTSDLDEGAAEYFELDEGAGYGGVAVFGSDGLLRSLLVRANNRGSGMGTTLLNHLLTHATTRGVKDIWLLTTTAENFFAKHGFTHAKRADAPAALAATSQFRDLCPSSAALMHRRLT